MSATIVLRCPECGGEATTGYGAAYCPRHPRAVVESVVSTPSRPSAPAPAARPLAPAMVGALVRRAFPGRRNSAIRAILRGLLTPPVDESWPVSHAERVRALGRRVAFSCSGAAALEHLALALEAALSTGTVD